MMRRIFTLMLCVFPFLLQAQISTFPYTEDFENGPGGWTSLGTNISWDLTDPNMPVINSAASGDSCWATINGNDPFGRNDGYFNDECSEVRSPFFDFTTLGSPIVRINVWWNSEFSWDGAVLQTSVDSGATWLNVGAFGDPNNWYTDNTIGGMDPFNCNLPSQEGWSGRNSSTNGSGGWVTAEHAVGYLANEPDVLFRMYFAADGSITDDGFAFDDFRVYNAPPNNAAMLNLERPISGCGLTTADSVEVTYTNLGSAAFDSLRLVYTINNGTPVREIDIRTINPGDTVSYTFATPANLGTVGVYSIDTWTELPLDFDLLNDSLTNIQIENVPTISTFPYFQNFDTNRGGWSSGGINSTWEWVEPDGAVINSAYSGTKSWVTDSAGTYNNNECSYVLSPCFNMGTLGLPIFRAYVWWDSETSWDGAKLQATTNNGLTWSTIGKFGDPDNWYNDSTINGFNPLNCNLDTEHGWSGDGADGSGGWVQVEAKLRTLSGQPQVRLRIAYGSDGSVNFFDGFAFDDVEIFEAPPADGKALALPTPMGGCGMGIDTLSFTYTNNGSQPFDSASVYYSINGATAVMELDTTTLSPGDTTTYSFNATYDFTTPGTYNVAVWVKATGDTDAMNDTLFTQVISVPTLSTFPYFENFDATQGGWTSFGTNNSWEWALPRGAVIDTSYSGMKSWVTDSAGSYNNSECSYVLSPCFNFGTLGLPIFRAKIWWDSEFSWDGAKLQTSTDNGVTWVTQGLQGDPNNWYNDSTINGFSPFNCNLDNEHGWTGDGPDGSGGWIEVESKLRTLGGQPSVRLRMFYGSDGSVNFFDGFAFDDVEIFEAPPADAKAVALLNPTSGCNLGTDSIIFSYTNNGSQAFDTANVFYSVNGAAPVSGQNILLVSPGDTTVYTFNTPFNFSTPGTYNVAVWVTTPGDTVNSNDTVITQIVSVPSVNTFPYFEDFESGSGGWASEGTNNTWQLGLPRGTVIDTAFSGVKAWMTDTVNIYNNDECSYVISPCYDFTSLALPQIKMMVWWDSEFSWDGAALQSTTDNGLTWANVGALGDPNNWYNDNTIAGLGNCAQSSEGWTGAVGNNGSAGWVLAEHKMGNLAGEPAVRLRVFFGSDGSVNGFDGFAFDDVEISEVLPDDLGVIGLAAPSNNNCGDSNAVVQLIITNFGSQPQFNFPVTALVNGSPLTATYPDTLRPEEVDTITVGVFNSVAGGAFSIHGFTDLTGDMDRSNDSMLFNINLITLPTAPITLNDSVCDPADSLVLVAIGNADVYFWYDSANGGNLVSVGDTFFTPTITQNTNYWVQGAARTQDTITSTFNNNNGCAGNYFDVTANSADIRIDSFDMNIDNFNTTELVKVYYRSGSYTGFTNSAAGWTLLDSAFVTPAGAGNGTRVPVGGLTIPAGQTFALAVEVVGNNNINYTNNPVGTISSNSDMTITFGDGFCGGVFTGSIAGRQWNGTIYYQGIGCPSPRSLAQAKIATPPLVDLGPDGAACSGTVVDATYPGATGYLWSTGATTPDIVVSLTGTYWVEVTNAQGCVGTDTVNLLIQPSPSVNLGPDTIACDQIRLNAGNPGAQYAWSTGDVTQDIVVSSSGTYSVLVTNAQGCSDTDSVVVGILPAPLVDLGADKTECDDAELDAGTFGAGHSYLWSTGATTQKITVNQTGLYTCTVTGPNGCDGIDDVVVNILPNPVVDLGVDTTGCDSVELNAGNPGASYTWNTGEQSQSIFVATTGNYFVEVLDNNGCIGRDTVDVTVAEGPNADFTFAYTGANTVAFTNASSPAGATYMWDFGDSAGSSTDPNPTYTYSFSGNYIVTLITTTAQCGSDTIEIALFGVDLDDLFGGSLQVYPNPSSGKFSLSADDLQADYLDIAVYDMNGKQVYLHHETQIQGEFEHAFDLSGQAEGVYLLQATDGQRSFKKRLIITR